MDVVMPKKDGIEELREIMASNPNIKVVMTSSVGTNDRLKEALSYGAYDFIQKPLSFKAITSIFEKV